MTATIQHRRTGNVGAAFPILNPGELAFNGPQLKIAMGDPTTGAPLELLAVRFFSTTSSYATNDFITNAGTLLRAVHPVAPGPFNAADWAGAAAGLSEAPIDGKAYGRKSAAWTQLAAADVTYKTGSVSDVLDNVVTSSSLISDNVTNTSGITGTTVSDSLVYLNNSLIAKAPLVSPALTGTPTVPTPGAGDSSTTVPNTAWVQARLAGKSSILTSDTVPVSPVDNTLWWESDTAKLYLRYNDGNSSQWVQVNAAAGMGGYVAKIGDSMTGPLLLSGNPTQPLGAVTKQYSDLKVAKAGDTMTGPLNINYGGSSLTPLTISLAAAGLPAVNAKNTVGAAEIQLDSPANQYKNIKSFVNGVPRWMMSLGDNAGEVGSNLGSSFILTAYTDDGLTPTQVMFVTRSTNGVSIRGEAGPGIASAGFVGEVISANVTSAVTLATGVQTNIGSISLPPGDWDIQGEIWIVTSAAASIVQGALNITSGVIPAAVALNTARSTIITSFPGAAGPNVLPLGPCRATLGTTTTYYLVGYTSFASGTASATGKIWARRAR